MSTFYLDNCKYEFTSDNVNIFCFLYDVSGSMEPDVAAMRKANIAFYDDFSEFKDKGSIAIAKAIFASGYGMSNFESIENFNTGYSVGGGTKLYYAICETVDNIIRYYNEIVKRLNVRPRITFLVFSDGDDNESPDCYPKAKEKIKELNSMDATTIFVAFRDAIKEKSGEKLGFTCTREIDNVNELISCMGKELSKSCKEQSKSAYSLKSKFFSKINNTPKEDEKTEEEIFDDNFWDIN